MSEIAHLRCPHPDCSSSDAFSYNTKLGLGRCHSCSQPYPARGVTYEDWVSVEYPTKRSISAGVTRSEAPKSKQTKPAAPVAVYVDTTEPVAPRPSADLKSEMPVQSDLFGLLEETQTEALTPLDVDSYIAKNNTPKKEGPLLKLPLRPVSGSFTPIRGITSETLRTFGVVDAVDATGRRVGHTYFYKGQPKYRILPKTFHTDKGFKADSLFGREVFARGFSKVLTITEGELDAMSAFQMTDSRSACVSIPSATPKKTFLTGETFEFIKSFTKIVACIDSDGKAFPFIQDLARLLPGRVYLMSLDPSLKDANGYLTAGQQRAFTSSWFSAEKVKPSQVISEIEDFLSILDGPSVDVLPTHIPFYDELAAGLARGHFTVMHGPEGGGKSETLRLIQANILRHHPDVTIAIAHLEERQKRTLEGLLSYALETNCVEEALPGQRHPAHLKQRMRDKMREFAGRIHMFTVGLDDDPEELENLIKYFALACEAQFVFVEPIQDIAQYRSNTRDETAEQYLTRLSTRLAKLAAELNIGIVTIAHENDNGEIRDCRMIGKRASVVIQMARDKLHEDPVIRNTLTLTIKKNRINSYTGHLGQLFFDPIKFILEPTNGFVDHDNTPGDADGDF